MAHSPSNAPPPTSGVPIELICADWQEFVNFNRINLGAGGMYVATEQPLGRGTAIRVNVVLPEEHGVLAIPATVSGVLSVEEARAKGKQPGMGIAFLPLSTGLKRHVDALLHVAQMSDASREHPVIVPNQANVAGTDKPGLSATESDLHDADFFDVVTEGHTGKISISHEVTFAVVTRQMNENNYAAAKAEINGIFATHPNDIRARVLWLVIEAREHLTAGRPDDAAAKYRQVMQLDANHVEGARELKEIERKSRSLIGKVFGR